MQVDQAAGVAGTTVALVRLSRRHPKRVRSILNDAGSAADGIAALHAHMRSRLAVNCRDLGLRLPDQLRAAKVDPNVSPIAAGHHAAEGGDWSPAEQMSRGDLKASRTGSGLRSRFSPTRPNWRHRRPRPLARVSPSHEGLAAVRWSRGLRTEMLGPIAQPARSDEELAADDVHGNLVVSPCVRSRIGAPASATRYSSRPSRPDSRR